MAPGSTSRSMMKKDLLYMQLSQNSSRDLSTRTGPGHSQGNPLQSAPQDVRELLGGAGGAPRPRHHHPLRADGAGIARAQQRRQHQVGPVPGRLQGPQRQEGPQQLHSLRRRPLRRVQGRMLHPSLHTASN